MTFDPEQVDAYEVGYKGTFRAGKLTAAFSALYYDYRDIRVTQIQLLEGGNILTNVVRNAAEAEVYGVDIDLRAVLTGGLSAGLAVSWLPNCRLRIVLECGRARSATARRGSGHGHLSSNRLNRAPEYSGTIGLNYSGALSSKWQVDARLELYLMEDIIFSPFNRPNAFNASLGFPGLVEDANVQKSYELVNAYLGFHYEEGLTIRLYGKNLTDEYYFTGITESSAPHTFTAN